MLSLCTKIAYTNSLSRFFCLDCNAREFYSVKFATLECRYRLDSHQRVRASYVAVQSQNKSRFLNRDLDSVIESKHHEDYTARSVIPQFSIISDFHVLYFIGPGITIINPASAYISLPDYYHYQPRYTRFITRPSPSSIRTAATVE